MQTAPIDHFESDMGPMTKELYSYWKQVRGDRLMPSRADIDPTDIPKLLKSILLLDIEQQTGRMKFRLTGTRITELYGTDYTGWYLDKVYFGRRRDAVLASYQSAIDDRCPHHCWMKFTNKDGLEFDMERLILPLSSDGQNVDKLISLLDIDLHRRQ